MYRLIVCEKTKDPLGDYLENLGTYNPRANPVDIQLKADRIKAWLDKGAQPSETVWNLLVDQHILEGDKRKTMRLSTTRKEKLNLKREEEKKAVEDAKAKEEARMAEERAKAQAEAATEALDSRPEPQPEAAVLPETAPPSAEEKPAE